MNRTRVIVFAGLLLAMFIVLNYWATIPLTPTIMVKFGFLPLSFMSVLLGPFLSGAAAAIGDIIGATIFPNGSFFFGFTISSFVTGVIYGLFLYKKPKTILRISLAVLCVTLLVDFGLNTYWLSLMYGKGFFVLLPGRVVKSLIMLPLQVTIIYTVWRNAGAFIEKEHFD